MSRVQPIRDCTEDERDEVHVDIDEMPDGRTLTQHRSFMWNGHLLVLAELNRINCWDDAAFDAATDLLKTKLSDDSETKK